MQNVLVDRAPLRLRRPARLLRLASDERLVALVRDGEEGAFEALYDRHHPAILGFCRHMLGTREEAEDAVQHTFLSAFRDLVGSEKPIDLRPWLFAIARNRCLSLLRARRAHVEIDVAEPAVDGLAATVERREDLRELLADLASLPEDQRAALLLAELGALDHAGIATVLGCPREKVKALVFQARTSLAASREARATPCEEIRVELATASGAALRRGSLRRHLRTCAGCRAFKTEIATQRRMLALALPVVPSVALKASVLAGSGGASASASGGGGAAAVTATATGTTASAGNGALGGLLGTVVSSGAGKAAVALVVAGAAAGGGALTGVVHGSGQPPQTDTPAARDAHRAARRMSTPPIATTGMSRSAVGALPAAGAIAPPTPRDVSHAPAPAARIEPDPAPAPATEAPSHGARQPGARQPASAPGHAHAGGNVPAHGGTTHPATPPAHGRTKAPQSTPPGHTRAPASTRPHPHPSGGPPPGHAPGHGHNPPKSGGQQGGSPPSAPANPSDSGAAPPSQSGAAPGQSGATPPGQSGTAPGQSGESHGKPSQPHGHAG